MPFRDATAPFISVLAPPSLLLINMNFFYKLGRNSNGELSSPNDSRLSFDQVLEFSTP